MAMRERRGHRRLRMTSKKHYETKKYFPKQLLVCIPRREVSILKMSLPLNLLRFHMSLPLTHYTDSALASIDILYNRLKKLEMIPSGIALMEYCISLVTIFLHL